MVLKRKLLPIVVGFIGILSQTLPAHAQSLPGPTTLPTGGQVVHGAASIHESGLTTTIQQTTQKAAIDWQSFSIGSNAAVNFVQPSADAIALNRVIGANPTQIFGQLKANGQVFIVNPQGVLFGQGAQVDAAGVLASTRSISNEDFAADRFLFAGSNPQGVVNQGAISVREGGYVALIGAQVTNAGSIRAPQGDVRLAAADKVELRIDNGGLTGFSVEQGTLDALAANQGLIKADGGRIFMTADAADALARAVVNNEGVLEAQTISNQGGVIRLLSGTDNGEVRIGGRVDVSAPTGQAGQFIATAKNVIVEEGARIDATGATGGGEVLLGGGWQGRDTRVSNASTNLFKRDALVDVSATGTGNAGTVVLWSDDYTGFHGDIQAKGGANGGNGGWVETSSAKNLNVFGAVDAGAAHGRAGEWLLDPVNVTIAASSASGTGYAANYNPTTDSTILASSIVSSLVSTNVTITTGSTGSSAGDITVAAPISVTSSRGNQVLTLKAANDINVNAAISGANERLNVVLNADSDASGAGNVNFGANGRVSTNGGNFYIGAVTSTGSSDTVARQGQNVTMATGSFIDVSGNLTAGGFAYAGMLDIEVNGTVSLAANTLRNTTGSYSYFNNGGNLTPGSNIKVNAGTITSSNTTATAHDILTPRNTTLMAGSIGDASNAIKIAGDGTYPSGTLSVTNTTGNSYVNQIGQQAFTNIAVTVGSQANSTQNLQILGDAYSTGTGHLLLNNDGSGVLNLATNDVRTAGKTGSPSVTATSVTISAPTMTFADGSVNTGTASFTANATTMQSVAPANNVADILSSNVTLNGRNIGSATNAVELATNNTSGTLYISNSGGSTFVKSVNDYYTNITMEHVKDVGTHSVLFSGGDHIDFTTNGSAVSLPTVSGGASDGSTFGATTGLDLSRRSRSFSLRALTGDILFGDDSVQSRGAVSFEIARYNSTGVMAAQSTYDAGNPLAQITAGNVSLTAANDVTPSVTTIGAGGKDIQIARHASAAADRTLTVSTQQGSVAVHELTQNYFKTINLTLGKGNAAQNVMIDLIGPDDINFSDTGTLVSVDATKVNLSDGNRNFSLSTPERSIRTDGNSPTTGSYSLNAGAMLTLGANIVTDGGSISLYGATGVNVAQSVVVDSNSDRVGKAGGITVGVNTNDPNASISSSGGSYTLALDASSTSVGSNTGGYISVNSGTDGRAGAFLSGLSFNAAGGNDASSNTVSLAGATYRLNGNFSSTGKTSLSQSNSAMLIDTEQGNAGNAGSITFDGANISSNMYYYLLTLDASTTAASANGGNVTLRTSNVGGAGFNTAGINVKAGAGSGGTKGDIALQAIATTNLYGGPVTQTYDGRIVTLYGDLTTSNGAVNITGEVRLANSVTIDTNFSNTGVSGALTVTGSSISATAPGQNLTIDTSSPSSNGGNVTLPTFNAAGGSYVNNLSIDTRKLSSGSHGSISLAGVATEGSQTYAGGNAALGGSLSTNGGNISLAGLVSTTLPAAPVSITTDRAGGTNAAGSLNTGTVALNGSSTLNLNTTADGGGAAGDITVGDLGVTTAFSAINVTGGNINARRIRATGDILVESRGATADVTVTGIVSTTNNGNIVIAAARNFTNNTAGGLQPNGTGRYLVYSTNPANTLENMSSYNKHYNQTYTAGATPSYAGSGNWFFYTLAPVLSVTSGITEVTYGNADPTISLSGSNYSGFIDGDTLATFGGSQTLTLTAPGTLSGAGYRQVGTYALNLNGSLTDNLGYQYAAYNESLVVAARNLAVSGTAAANRDYDGSTLASLSGSALATVLSGDTVSLNSSVAVGNFADKDVGNSKAVTVTGYAINGADASNYVVVQPTGVTANITPKALAITGSTATDKTYNRDTTATVTAGTVNGLVGGETLAVGASGTFVDRNAGANKNVNTTYTLGNGSNGGVASNYTLAAETLQATIAQKVVVVAAAGTNRNYDGTLNASVALSSGDILLGDTVAFTGSGQFADKNAGLGKTVNITGIGSASADAQNYSFGTTASTTANITPKSLTISGTVGANKSYDGTTAATITAGLLSGFVASETVSVVGEGAFADKNAGANKNINVSYTLADGSGGGAAGNYSLNGEIVQATITPKAISVSASAADKIYDGNTAANATFASSDLLVGDTVNFTANAQFDDKNAGLNKTVNITGITSADADAQNYSFGTTNSATATITPKALTIVGSSVNDKTYDGTIAATIAAGNLFGFVGGETVFASGSGQFLDKNAGTNKDVLVTYNLTNGANGGLGSNYSVAGQTLQANILQRAISIAALAQNKIYDGSLAMGVALSSNGILAGDTVSFDGSAALLDKNAGQNKTVNVTGIGATGTDAQNYSYNATTSTTADVAQKAITVDTTAQNKIYDGSLLVDAAFGSSGIVTGDNVSFDGSATLTDKNAGLGKTVNVTGIVASGADTQNYSYNFATGTTIDVAQRAITIDATAQNKTYDGNLVMNATLVANNLVAGDSVSFGGTAALLDKNAGQNKTVNVTGIAATGIDAQNYSYAATASTTANIAQKSLTVVAKAVDRVYDGTLATTATFASTDIVTGDAVSFSGSAQFADKNAGASKTVNVTGIALGGVDGANYSISNSNAATTASITPRSLTVGLVGPITRDGDGTTAATLTPDNFEIGGIVTGESISISQTNGIFADANSGVDKQVSTNVAFENYGSGAGTDLANYALFIGTLSANVGQITDAVLGQPSYLAALASFSTFSSTSVQSGLGVSDDGASTLRSDSGTISPWTITRNSPRGSAVETFRDRSKSFSRTFAITEGGIRLPRGLSEEDFINDVSSAK